jgi:hypothetical protein
MNLYNRQAQLKIGKAGQTGVLIKGLRVAFSIVKTITSESNSCIITINNLTKATRSIIKADTGVLVELSVGYEELDNLEVIFIGDVVNVDNNETKPDITTVITLEDGYEAIKKKRVSLSYKSGASLRQIITDASKALLIPEKTRLSDVAIPNITFQSGYAFEGYAADLLDRLCGDNSLEWSVQNNEFKITTKAATDNSGTMYTTLIGSPKRINKKPRGDSTEEEFKGFEIRTMLLPKAEPGGSIWLESKEVSPAVKLKVIELKHSGDTHGADWTTLIKAKDL